MVSIRASLIAAVVLSTAVVASAAHAQSWFDFALVSMTDPISPKLVNSRLCYTDGDAVACDGAAGRFTTSGSVVFTNISATALTVNGV